MWCKGSFSEYLIDVLFPDYFFYELYGYVFEELDMALAGMELMEPRLLAILQNNGVADSVMDKLGNAGVVQLNVFACCGIDKQRFIDFVSKAPLT